MGGGGCGGSSGVGDLSNHCHDAILQVAVAAEAREGPRSSAEEWKGEEDGNSGQVDNELNSDVWSP